MASNGNPVTIAPLAEGRKTSFGSELVCPPDKSVTHRAILFAAMATGRSLIERPLLGADCRSTMAAMQALGVSISQDSPEGLIVQSPGIDGWHSPVCPLDFGNSGTTTRLLIGLFASRPGVFITCFGDASLSKRPMKRVVTPLRAMGATILGRDGGDHLPLAIEGKKLRAASHQVDKASAQVKSALLLAGLNTEGQTEVELPAGSRDHTERMLMALGASLRVVRSGKLERITLQGPFRPPAGRFAVPGDPSSAAFLCVLGALGGPGQLTVKGVLDNATRMGFLEVLAAMGASIEKRPVAPSPGQLEPVVDLVVRGGEPLRGADVDESMAPRLIDEVPILAVAAALSRGQSRFRGLAELRVKESDRLAKTAELVKAMGAEAAIKGDDLIINGRETTAKALDFNPDFDHRLAMAAAVAARFAEAPSRIHDPTCVDVSFPGFFDQLLGLR